MNHGKTINSCNNQFIGHDVCKYLCKILCYATKCLFENTVPLLELTRMKWFSFFKNLHKIALLVYKKDCSDYTIMQYTITALQKDLHLLEERFTYIAS